VDATGAPAGSRTLRIKLGSTLITSLNFSISNIAFYTLLIFNDGATNDQHVSGFILLTNTSGVPVLLVTSSAAEDSTADMDLEITGQLSNGADTLTLEMSHVTLLGTD
jgi:hypothetical protein